MKPRIIILCIKAKGAVALYIEEGKKSKITSLKPVMAVPILTCA
jgi:hypothetical protein